MSLSKPIARSPRGALVLARQGGGPGRPADRYGGPGQRGGRGREGSPQPRPSAAPLVLLQDAGAWWQKNVFKGATLGRIIPIKLPNGQAARPGLGTAGKPIQVATNHLRLSLQPRQVAQWEVTVTKLPRQSEQAAAAAASGASGDPDSGRTSDSDTGRASGGKGGGGGGGGRAGKGAGRRGSGQGVKVVDKEAHAVLSYMLGTTASGEAGGMRGRWVYDGGAALYTAIGGGGGGGADGDADLPAEAAGGGGGVTRLVEVPLAAGGEAAGGRYKVSLRRTALIDVAQCLKDAQALRQQQLADAKASAYAAATAPSSGTSTNPGGSDVDDVEDEAVRWASRVPESTSEQAALAVLELVSRDEAAWDPDAVRVGRGSYVSYRQEDRNTKIAGLLPLKVLSGFRSAVSRVAAGITLTIDTATAVVAEDGPLLPQIEQALGVGSGGLAQRLREKGNARALQEALEGLEVKYNQAIACDITYKLTGNLSDKAANRITFKDNTGQQTTVAEYFKRRYGFTLKHPDLPCATDKKGAALPLELLNVKRAQKRNQRLQDRQKAELIRATAQRPDVRLKAMTRALQSSFSSLLASAGASAAAAFGLRVARDFLKVDGRLLPGPLLEVRDARRGSSGGLEPGNAGEWRSPGVAQAAEWRSGAVLCYLDPNKDGAAVTALVSQLRKSLEDKGAAKMPPDLPVVWASPPKPGGKDPSKEAAGWLQQAARRAETKYGQPPQLVLVVLPAGRLGGDTYDAIKTAADGTLGIPTQCIDPFKAKLTSGGPAPAYTDQLGLSVNAKLGGVTTRLAGRPQEWLPSLAGRRLMVLGADVSRGAAAVLGGRGGEASEADPAAAPSIEYVAVVASVDSHCVEFAQSCSAQSTGSRDVIVGMRESVADLLRTYAASRHRGGDQQRQTAQVLPAASLPEVLLMYRDGVSDSMFDAVLAEEYTAMQQACEEVGGPSYRPAVTFLVVQKSHNTRFFPASPAGQHKSGNVLPGTVIEMGVVDDVLFDFFLNSHAGIQGTNRAPRYTVLADSWGFTADDLQLLTFGLCHTYAACSRALSLAPSARLAHLAADRARTALRDQVGRPNRAAAALAQAWYQMLKAPVPASTVI